MMVLDTTMGSQRRTAYVFIDFAVPTGFPDTAIVFGVLQSFSDTADLEASPSGAATGWASSPTPVADSALDLCIVRQ